MSSIQARNEMLISAPAARIWALVTDINLLHRINPGVVRATGAMDKLNSTRVCELDNNGRRGTATERLIEWVPEQRTVWAMESDTMGMTKMLRDIRFYMTLEKVADSRTRLIAETHYTPAHFPARIMNALMMKRMIARAQSQILSNIRSLAE